MSEKPNLFKGAKPSVPKNDKSEISDSESTSDSAEILLSDAPLSSDGPAASQAVGPDDELRKMFEESKLFDAEWYLNQNPDVAAAKIDPFTHYLFNGEKEGRNPSNDFDVVWYAKTYPDFENHGLGLLEHYLLKGRELNKTRSQSDLREKLEHDAAFAQQKHACKMVALRTYTYSILKRRINLLIDNDRVTSTRNCFLIAALLANATDSSLRIITRTSRCDERSFKQELISNNVQIPTSVEFTFCDFLDTKVEIPISRWDIFIANDLVNVLSLLPSIHDKNIIFLKTPDPFSGASLAAVTPAQEKRAANIETVTISDSSKLNGEETLAIVAQLNRNCESVFV